MEFSITLISVLVVVASFQFAQCDIQSNINILTQTQTEADRLRRYPDNLVDPDLKAQTNEAFLTTRVVVGELKTILLFQKEVEANPDLALLNCIQLHEHLLKIKTNISITERRALKFSSWNTMSTNRIIFYNIKLKTATGNYTTIYTKLITIYTQLKAAVEETFEPLEAFIDLLNTNASPVKNAISSKSSYCANFTFAEISLHISDLTTTIQAAKNLGKYPEPRVDPALNSEIKWGIDASQDLQNKLSAILRFQIDGIAEFETITPTHMNCLQLHEYLTKLQANISTNQVQLLDFESLPVGYSGRITHFQAKLPSATGNVTKIYTDLISIFNELTQTAQESFMVLMAHLNSLETFENPFESEFQNRCPGFNQETTLPPETFTNSMSENQVIYPSGFPVSSNGLYEMVLLLDGDFVTRHRTTGEVVFRTGTSGQGGIKVVLQSNGALAMLNANGDVVISSEAYSTPVPGSQLTLLNNGHFILSKDNQISFGSEFSGPPYCYAKLNTDFYSLNFAAPVGTYFEGTPVYLGEGQFTSCEERLLPARITSYGAYAACGKTSEQFEGSNDGFYYNHPNFTLTNVDFQNLANYVYYHTTGDSYVGVVVQVSSATRGNFTTIGRYSTAAGGVVYWNGDVEVLATQGTFGVFQCPQ